MSAHVKNLFDVENYVINNWLVFANAACIVLNVFYIKRAIALGWVLNAKAEISSMRQIKVAGWDMIFHNQALE